MTTHLIELPLSLRALHLWAGHRKLHGDEGLMLHHLLGEAFGPAVLQPFRILVAPRARDGSLYAYASVSAEILAAQAAMTLTPDLASVLDLARIRSLPRPDTWTCASPPICKARMKAAPLSPCAREPRSMPSLPG
jgi:CRISPR system Cascade subunit CasE